MIPRIRPYFDEGYISAFRGYDPEIPREELVASLATRLHGWYPDARQFAFFDLGRNAMGAAFDALGLKEGDEVILPAFTCPSVCEPVLARRLRGVLVDMTCSLGMDTDQLRRSVSDRTRAIVSTHLFGIPSNTLETKEIADEHGIPLIEDCAQTFCTAGGAVTPGTIGDMAFTSFKNDKPHALGNGSMLVINTPDYLPEAKQQAAGYPLSPVAEEKLAFLSLLCFFSSTDPAAYTRFIGTRDYYQYFQQHPAEAARLYARLDGGQPMDIPREGRIPLHQPSRIMRMVQNLFPKAPPAAAEPPGPSAMNTFLLTMLLQTVPYIDMVNAARRTIGRIYDDRLGSDPSLITPPGGGENAYLRYPVICRDDGRTRAITAALTRAGYEVGNFNWPEPMNAIFHVRGDFSRAERIAKNIINLPSHLYVSEADAHAVCDIIGSVTGG